MIHSFFHSFFGDLMKDNTLWLFQTNSIGNVPGDSLSLTVGVGSEDDLGSLLGNRFDLGDHLVLTLRDFVMRDEASRYVYCFGIIFR